MALFLYSRPIYSFLKNRICIVSSYPYTYSMYESVDDTCYTCYHIIRRRKEMRFREVEKMILQDGWYEVKQVGSHHPYKHPTKTGKVTIPEHKGKDINSTVVKSILKQAGL